MTGGLSFARFAPHLAWTRFWQIVSSIYEYTSNSKNNLNYYVRLYHSNYNYETLNFHLIYETMKTIFRLTRKENR